MTAHTVAPWPPSAKGGRYPTWGDEDPRVSEAFTAFCVAAQRAQASRRLSDGIEAGRRWARFLALFEGR